MGYFQDYLRRPDILRQIHEITDRAVILPEDMPRPDVMVPQALATLNASPELYAGVDKLVMGRWKFQPHLLNFSDCGEEAVVWQTYGAPFILKITTSPDSDMIHGSQFVAKPVGRRSVIIDDEHAWERGTRPVVEVILERWLYPYNALEIPGKSYPEDWVVLKSDDKRSLEHCLLYEGLKFKDQKLSNVRFYGIDYNGEKKLWPRHPVITDVGSLERVMPQRNRLSTDANAEQYMYERDRGSYLQLHSTMCPSRGPEAAVRVAQMSEAAWKRDQRIYQELSVKKGMTHDDIVHHNMDLAAARNRGLQNTTGIIHDPDAIRNYREGRNR